MFKEENMIEREKRFLDIMDDDKHEAFMKHTEKCIRMGKRGFIFGCVVFGHFFVKTYFIVHGNETDSYFTSVVCWFILAVLILMNIIDYFTD